MAVVVINRRQKRRRRCQVREKGCWPVYPEAEPVLCSAQRRVSHGQAHSVRRPALKSDWLTAGGPQAVGPRNESKG